MIQLESEPVTVKPVIRDHCYEHDERPNVLKDQIFLAESPTFQLLNLTQRPPS